MCAYPRCRRTNDAKSDPQNPEIKAKPITCHMFSVSVIASMIAANPAQKTPVAQADISIMRMG